MGAAWQNHVRASVSAYPGRASVPPEVQFLTVVRPPVPDFAVHRIPNAMPCLATTLRHASRYAVPELRRQQKKPRGLRPEAQHCASTQWLLVDS